MQALRGALEMAWPRLSAFSKLFGEDRAGRNRQAPIAYLAYGAASH